MPGCDGGRTHRSTEFQGSVTSSRSLEIERLRRDRGAAKGLKLTFRAVCSAVPVVVAIRTACCCGLGLLQKN